METWRSRKTSRILPVNIAEELSMIAARETAGLKPTEEQILLLLSRSCPQVETEQGAGFLLSDFVNFMKNLKQAISTKDSSFLLQKRGLCVDKIVSIEEFCTSSLYMNQKSSIRPLVLAGLIELFDSENSKNYIECVLTGAIRWGKCVVGSTTFFDAISCKRMTIAEAATTGQKLLVQSLYENGKISCAQATAAPSGKKQCLTITFSGGQHLTVSYDHPFRVRDGYLRADKLTFDTLVACDRYYPKEYTNSTNLDRDVVPITINDLELIFQGMPHRVFTDHPHQYIPLRAWQGIVNVFPDIPYAWLAHSDLVWEHPVKIEDGGLQEVYDLCVPETGNFVANGVVVHNTYFSYMAMAYMVYYLSCFHNPQLELDMAPGSTITLIQQSQRYELAKKVIFEQFAQILKLSPYFAKSFPPDLTLKSELRFPNNIVILPVGGSDTAVLGMNTIFAVIDEMNFMLKTKSSERMSMTGAVSGDEYDHAERVYTTLVRRMKAQYIQKGGTVPGKLLLISSVNYAGDFTDRKLKEAQTDKSILPLSYTQWEVLPPDRFSGKKFLVEVGNEYKQSRIVRYRSEAKDEGDLLEVPVEYQKDFERDIESALKDYAGRTTGASHPFIPYRELIAKAQDDFEAMYDGQQLFLYPSIVIDDLLDPNSPDWEQLINMDFIENNILAPTRFTAHIDVGVSEDAAGISIGHLLGYKLLPSSKYFDPHMNEFVEITDIRAPIYCIDGVLQVKPSVSGRQIDLALIRDMVLWLRGRINLHFVTMDSYQSTMMIQAFRRSKIRSGILSVDTSIEPYAEVKQAIKDERIYFPKHPILAKELRELEKVKGKDKVDHPSHGTKDVADSIAGVVHILKTKEAKTGGTTSARRRSRIANAREAGEIEPAQEDDNNQRRVRRLRLRRRV